MRNNYKNEIWKDVVFDDNIRKDQHFKVSNFGRIKSFNINTNVGRMLKPGRIKGYKIIVVKQKNNKNTVKYVHLLVAKAFLNKKEDEQFVIHLNYKKMINKVENLKWVNKVELSKHFVSHPKQKYSISNLTIEKVKLIKKKVANIKKGTTLKSIADEFGITTMQLYRIRTGKSWSYVTID